MTINEIRTQEEQDYQYFNVYHKSHKKGGRFNLFPQEGTPKGIVQQRIEDKISHDLTYESGKIFGAMTQPGHPFAQEIYNKYMTKNLGDPGLVTGTKEIENEIIGMLGELLNDQNIQGNIVSGGTEANLIALMIAKENASVSNPEVVIPESAHYSFDKAAILMGLKLRRAKLDSNYNLDLDHYDSLINENTIALVGIAGTTALGLIDPLEGIGKLARKHDKFFHVDGAFGGLVFPFLKELGVKLPKFDFSIPEITSYTIDPHKFGMGINPTGGFLIRGEYIDNIGFLIPYLAGGGFKSFNILGTRPGASALSFWGLMQHLGMDGFKNTIQQTWENTNYLIEELKSIPELTIATQPQSPVLGLKTTGQSHMSIEKIDHKLRLQGWALGYFKQWDLLRVVLMPHITQTHIDAFITTVKTVLK